MKGGFELLQVGDDLLGGAKVGLGYNFDEGNAAAVIVGPGLVDPGVVHQLSRILLHVKLVNADGLFRTGGGLDGHGAVPDNGEIELGDLVGLGQVGVKVVLPIKFAVAGDSAV